MDGSKILLDSMQSKDTLWKINVVLKIVIVSIENDAELNSLSNEHTMK